MPPLIETYAVALPAILNAPLCPQFRSADGCCTLGG
jgi:hypothetical protein